MTYDVKIQIGGKIGYLTVTADDADDAWYAARDMLFKARLIGASILAVDHATGAEPRVDLGAT
jgi:hypothetical protein